MSIEDIARSASGDLRSHTAADVDAGLGALFVANSRRSRQARAAVALSAAAAVAAAWWGGANLGAHRTAAPPATGTGNVQHVCDRPLVTCKGDRTYRFGLDSPVAWQIPQGYGVDSGAGANSQMVESYALASGPPSGVTVMEGVRTASRTEPTAPARGVPRTAAGFIDWLASRPFFHASAPRRTTLDGHDAWEVRVSMRPGLAQGPGWCLGDTTRCYPVTSRPVATGLWDHMVAEYTAIDVPGSGTLVVWSWAFGHDTRALARARTVVDGISLPG
jgi:hypothetical protein